MPGRFVWREGRGVIPIEEAEPVIRSRVGGVMPDIAPFATQDGTPIGSRSALRAYEQRTGTKQVGNDFASLVSKLKGEG